MLQKTNALNQELFNPLVPKAHDSACRNLPLPLQTKPAKNSVKLVCGFLFFFAPSAIMCYVYVSGWAPVFLCPLQMEDDPPPPPRGSCPALRVRQCARENQFKGEKLSRWKTFHSKYTKSLRTLWSAMSEARSRHCYAKGNPSWAGHTNM